jgi:ketosteroid isomerase-like protein
MRSIPIHHEVDNMTGNEVTAAKLIAMERAALDRWGAGDPSGYLEISAPDVVYFDPFLERRLDGLEALTTMYESLRGSVHIDRCELIEPKVQVCGEAAVLTFNLKSYTGATVMHWNCTEVFRLDNADWRLIQTHWSITQHLKG